MIAASALYRARQTLIDTSVGATDQTLKNVPGSVTMIDAENRHASEWYFLKLYDAATVNVGTAVPKYSFAIAPGTAINLDFHHLPLLFETAIHYAVAQERGAGATAPTTAPTVMFEYFSSD